jgi:probable HAF family extracellular repeat protein
MVRLSCKTNNQWWRFFVPLLLVLVCAAMASAQSSVYKITDLGSIGGTESFAYALNDKGQVVGQSRLAGDAGTHAFLYSKGTLTDIYPLNSQETQTAGPTAINNAGQIASGVIFNGVYSPAIYESKTNKITMLGSLGGTSFGNFNGVATAINATGQAVGYSHLDSVNRHAFLYENGVLSDIGSFGGYSFATGINDSGMIVGASSNSSTGVAHAFLYANGVMRDIAPLGNFSGSESYAEGINNGGQVVGTFLTADRTAFHAFLYENGLFKDIGATSGPLTEAYGINDHGQVVGTGLVPYNDTCFDYLTGFQPCIKYKFHAFLYEKGKMTDLNNLIQNGSRWELAFAFDINNAGQIVGYGLVDGQSFRAFLLTK